MVPVPNIDQRTISLCSTDKLLRNTGLKEQHGTLPSLAMVKAHQMALGALLSVQQID